MGEGTKAAADLQVGDRFRHKGVLYEVVGSVARGRYSTINAPVRRVLHELVVLDYTERVAVVDAVQTGGTP